MQVGDTKIKFKIGDLTEEEVDTIVNAANNKLWMGGGVAGAIRKKGGKIIEDEAVSKGPIPIGEAVVTGAGSLKAKYVIHGAVMGMDFKTDSEKIREATLNSLRRAEEIKVGTIAFPAFGTGVGRFPSRNAAKAMLSAVKDHLKNVQSSLKKIVFVLYNEEIYNAFAEAAQDSFGSSQ
jgi:O-acetyl-ADP-ribose deacetylase (regulator of RNase III)